MRINDNFEKLPESYLFSEVARKLREYKEAHPDTEVIRMDIGDVTRPLAPVVIEAMHKAVEDLSTYERFHGYGPEQGYAFLRDSIAEYDYKGRGIAIESNEIFISDGAKSDLGNLGDIYSHDSIIATTDPGYPVYVDTAVMSGRGGELENGKWNKILYLDCNESNGFQPTPPEEHADVVILCSPNNPTGVAYSRENLEEWVKYAHKHQALIIYDSAYEAFEAGSDLPRSIYEIKGAEKVAIEVRSFSKTAGFTGVRCGYTVVPKGLVGRDSSGREVSLRKLWNRRQTTKFNGASYIVQRGAEALYSEEGRVQVRETIDYYLENAKIIRRTLHNAGYKVFGGEYSPYVWVKSKENLDSWSLFAKLLEEKHISCTPGVGFGNNGNGYIRLTGFNTREKTIEAMERFR